MGGSRRSARALQRSRSTELRTSAAASAAARSRHARRHNAAVTPNKEGQAEQHTLLQDENARLKAAMGQREEELSDMAQQLKRARDELQYEPVQTQAHYEQAQRSRSEVSELRAELQRETALRAQLRKKLEQQLEAHGAHLRRPRATLLQRPNARWPCQAGSG